MQKNSIKNAISTLPAVIVVVDDDQAVRNSLKFSLEIEGFAVRTYQGPQELLAESELPQQGCLILDYKLPGMSGLQLLAKLRDRKVYLPALLITTHPSLAVYEEASRAGAQVIEKPLLGEALLNGIRQAIERQQTHSN